MRLIMGMALALILFSFYVSRADDTIKIGVILAMTGGTSAFGQQTWTGMQIGRNIRPTVLGKKVELILLDNKIHGRPGFRPQCHPQLSRHRLYTIDERFSSNSLAI